MAGFEPPAYISSLIASINDGARAAQTGGLFMLAIAVYLMATMISTSDEVLLRGSFVDFSQIGVKVPVVASYALAPLVFLFLYVHTLIRYDMLAENLRLFDRELRTSLACEADRDRCRQLLANVEFVQYWTAPAGSPWHSRVYRVLVWLMLVAIPILVFLATQISFLRYQNAFVTYVIHLGSLATALSAGAYFWYRQARRRRDWQPLDRRGQVRTLAWAGWPSALMMLLAVIYLRIPPPDSTTAGKPHAYFRAIAAEADTWRVALKERNGTAVMSASWQIAVSTWRFQPLDLLACPFFNWGCRYLRLDHRMLVQEKPEGDPLFKLRTDDGDLKKLLLRVEAPFLRDCSFRFADFSESEFMTPTSQTQTCGEPISPRHACRARTCGGAQLQGAGLGFAQLHGADL